jgi:thioredoxin-like negative regulator of GroEL
MKTNGHGDYLEITSGKQFLEITTQSKRVICHFYKTEFKRCMIVDRHMKLLSSIYFETRWLRFNVEQASFFVEKLKIQVLPCVLVFLDGRVIDRIVGFEELGNIDTFSSATFAKRLARSGIIEIEGKEGNVGGTVPCLSSIDNLYYSGDDSSDDE